MARTAATTYRHTNTTAVYSVPIYVYIQIYYMYNDIMIRAHRKKTRSRRTGRRILRDNNIIIIA